MLSMLGISFFTTAAAVYYWTLRRRGFRRYPAEIFVLLGIAVVFGALGTADRPSLLTGLLLCFELVALVAAILYLGVGARFPRSRVSVSPGERLPRFTLPDSTGRPFRSKDLEGKSAALYLFYRGDW
jgi:cytochrome oxidase Cu insertion factor (SCO1/SenC/PrrC family)